MLSQFIRSAAALCGALLLIAGTWARAVEADVTATRVREQWHSVSVPQGRTLRVLVTSPGRATLAPIVILLHEDRGLTAWEQQVACELAEDGFVALVPDFLSELGPDRGATESFESRAAVRDALLNLSAEQVTRELNGVAAFARELPGVNHKLVVVGFDWGATQAFRYAGQNPDLAAVFVFYGATPNEEWLQKIHTPVYGFYGEKDVTISADVPKLKVRMAGLNKQFLPVVYAGARHSFLRTGAAHDAMPADRQAHDEARARWKLLLGQL